LEGDGIGPEVVESAVKVLQKAGAKFGHRFVFAPSLIGGCAYDATGNPLPAATVENCLGSDGVLLGAVGGPKWDGLPGSLRPEAGLLGIRSAMALYSNLRPARLYTALKGTCPLRKDIADRGFDILIVREFTGGIYYGKRGRAASEGGEEAFDTEAYSVREIERIGRVAFEAARSRKRKLTSVDKANILETSRLWREVIHRLASGYPDVAVEDMYVDNAAMQLVRNPSQFDVIVASNMFGDILSDEASQLTGSIGLNPSASLGDGTRGLYEPIHGSAPDIAGKGVANPIATVLSAAMMLRHSFGLFKEAASIETAVDAVLAAGLRTADIASEGEKAVGTGAMTEAILAALDS